MNLPKERKDLYTTNYNTLMKEIKDDTDGEIHCVFGLEELILSTWLPKAIYRFNAIPVKLPMAFSTELEQKILNFMKTQNTPNSQSNFEKEKQAGGIRLPDFSEKWKCLTLCNCMDCSPPGFSVHGTLQARILEWGAIPFSRGSSQPRYWIWISCIAIWEGCTTKLQLSKPYGTGTKTDI